jgi:hypothetical protein
MNPAMLRLTLRTLGYQMTGRLHTRRERIGTTFTNGDGREFIVFKETILDPAPSEAKMPQAVFRVQFQVPRIVRWRDRLIIALKSPMFVGQPGFRSKLWMVDEKNCVYQGVYEWDTIQAAEEYAHSTSMAFMRSVAVPGGLSYEIVPAGKVVQRGSSLSIAVPQEMAK